MIFSNKDISMKPRPLDINPDPDKHSGHFRLQKFVSSILAETGIPYIDIFPVKELTRNEYPDPIELRDLKKVSIIGQVKQHER